MLAKFLHCFLRALWLEQNREWPRGSCCLSWWMELEASGGLAKGIGAEVMKRGYPRFGVDVRKFMILCT